jgi:hypothetical protein
MNARMLPRARCHSVVPIFVRSSRRSRTPSLSKTTRSRAAAVRSVRSSLTAMWRTLNPSAAICAISNPGPSRLFQFHSVNLRCAVLGD